MRKTPKILRSVCPFDCPDTCGLLVTVQDGRAIKVTGDPAHPVTRGLLCPKMQHYEETVHSPRRLTQPLVRVGPKSAAEFAPISWQEAIDRICTQWTALIAEYGGECILPYSYAGTMGLVQRNSGHPLFHALGASRLERTICSPAKDAGWKMIMGNTPALEPDEIEHSDLVILWGINAAATSIHSMRDALAAKRRGAQLWVIDTYASRTAEAATESFLVTPGSDGALALGMFISITTKSQLLASQLAMILTFLPSFLLSGFMYDIGNMPRAVQLITYVVPARYFVSLLKGIYLKGVGLEILGYEAALLTVFGAVMVFMAVTKFKKRLE